MQDAQEMNMHNIDQFQLERKVPVIRRYFSSREGHFRLKEDSDELINFGLILLFCEVSRGANFIFCFPGPPTTSGFINLED